MASAHGNLGSLLVRTRVNEEAEQSLRLSVELCETLREREPDAPNYTPRITAKLDCRRTKPDFELSLLKANSADPDLTDRIVSRPAESRNADSARGW